MSVNLIATTAGALNFLTAAKAYQEVTVGGVWHVHLFSNNHTVVDGDDIGSFTEASFSGYALATPTWTTPALSGGVPTTTSSSCTFTYSGVTSTTFYGVYVTDSANAKLLAAANTPTSVTLTPGQPSWSAVINMTAISQF